MASPPTRIQRDRILLRRRWQRNGHQRGVMWFTGLSGSGKSTLAMALERHLFDEGYQVFALDGDNLRHGLNSDLGFSPQDRQENIRRIGEIAAMFAGSGFVVLTAFISPDTRGRERARRTVGEGFHEIFLDPGLDACERRDPRGLYKKARAGEIPQFTGISAPYELPTDPDIRLDTATMHVEDCVGKLAHYANEAFKKHQP